MKGGYERTRPWISSLSWAECCDCDGGGGCCCRGFGCGIGSGADAMALRLIDLGRRYDEGATN